MIVSATDYNFRGFTEIFIRALFRNGKINTANFILFIFDTVSTEEDYDRNCLRTSRHLKKISRGINIEIIPFNTMQKVINKFERSDSMFISTYLRSFIYYYIRVPYLWIDADVVVRKGIAVLYNDCKKKNLLALALDKFFFDADAQYYYRYTRTELSQYLKNLGTFNCGVAFVPRDYTKLWLDIFYAINDPFYVNIGQVVWNIIAWLEKGAYILPQTYNTFYNRDSNSRNAEAVLLHFIGDDKKYMKSYDCYRSQL